MRYLSRRKQLNCTKYNREATCFVGGSTQFLRLTRKMTSGTFTHNFFFAYEIPKNAHKKNAQMSSKNF